jgi:FAD-linked oxidoreductase
VSWTNWSGSVRCRPASIARPRTLDELRRIVTAAAADGATAGLRVAGSGHSFTPLAATEGTLVSLEHAAGVVSTDKEARVADVLAGTTLRRLGPELAAAGLAMENLGDIDAQALAGALATGTHGTGAGLGSLSTQIAGLRLVLADGDVLDLSPVGDADLFKAAQVSLGALGVVWQVRLRLVPVFRLRYVRRNMDLEDCLARLPELREHRHFELYWFPFTARAATKTMDETTEPSTAGGFGRWFDDIVLENGAFGLLSEACRLVPSLCAPVSRLSAAVVSEGSRIGASYRVFATPRHVRFQEMEYAVAADRGPDCLREIRRFVDEKKPAVHFPVEFRLVKADDIWLSPAFGRDSVYIAVHMYRGMPYRAYFDGVEAIFRNHGGRPHWGKMHTRTAAELEALYPEWGRFHEVRRRLDPRGVFLNPYLRGLFGEGR